MARWEGGRRPGRKKGPARGWRGSGIDGEDRLGFTLMCVKVVVDISWYSKIYSYKSQVISFGPCSSSVSLLGVPCFTEEETEA